MKASASALAALMLAGCAHQSNELTGQQVGILLGALVGASIGHNSSARVGGAVAGAVIGGVIGGQVGRRLDEADRQKAEAAAQVALRQPDPASVQWRSDRHEGVRGEVVTAPPLVTSRGTCKEVVHVFHVNGVEQRETTRACQRPDGSWTFVQ